MADGPQYLIATDIPDIVYRLMKKLAIDSKFSVFCDYARLDLTRFAYMKCVRSAPSHNGIKNVAKIQPIAEPISLLTPVRYIITVYNGSSDWDTLTDEQKELVLLHEFLHVDLDHEFNHPDWDKQRAGRLLGHDLQDFRKMIEILGVNWFNDAGAKATTTAPVPATV